MTPDICSIDDIGLKLSGEDAQPYIDAVNEYLKVFAKPVRKKSAGDFLTGNTQCFRCEADLGGLLGSFVYGICHGEGMCRHCRWPARALHYIQIDGKDMFTGPLEMILQYHPSVVSDAKKTSKEPCSVNES